MDAAGSPEALVLFTYQITRGQSLEIIVFRASNYLCIEYLKTLSAFRPMQWNGIIRSEH
jgi:hypothetical protein